LKPEFAGASVAIHELDNMPNGDSIQQTLASMTGQRTVPNVWVNGKHIGGNDDTQQAYRSGSLLSMLGLK
jgi:glutaredoxin 3